LLAKDIPPMVKEALILELDPTFEENVGVDNTRILEGLRTLIRTQGSTVPEMDTIAQKVIENVFLTDVAGVDKICEKYIGAKYLTAKYSKDEIIEFYCNSASCGKDIRGLQEASYVYFKTDFNSLSLKQQVYLCALLIDSREKNESILHKQALEKSESLLNKLESVGIITEEEYNKAKDEKIAVKNR
ncbi:MAG: transglycosylase domain-containing protein, partial [Lachnospiraceae bacterium]|nr:transglycosylase domain-containing protein [Lachnospiraceae bacterium]